MNALKIAILLGLLAGIFVGAGGLIGGRQGATFYLPPLQMDLEQSH